MSVDFRTRIQTQGHRLSIWTANPEPDQSLCVRETGLCNVCTCFLKESESRRALWRPHHQTADSLAKAVKDGCVMCSELWYRIDPEREILEQPSDPQWEEWKINDHPELFVIGWWSWETKDSFSMCLSVDGPRPGSVERRFISTDRVPFPESTSQAEQATYDPSLLQVSSTGDTDVMGKALQWIKACRADHSCAADDTSWRPSRLVDVDPPEGQHLFRVISSAAGSTTAPYLSLSHCWGGNEGILKLTKANHSRLHQATNKDDLPATFRDAMNVCRNLNVRYIWIDSLCIIQDDPSDWDTETQSMCYVYKYALCNIAATANSNSSLSLFRERHRRTVAPFQVTISKYVSSASNIAQGTYSMVDGRLWMTGTESQPLNKRAWVFQERLLSPRTLHFSYNQVIWECGEMASTETYPNSAAIHLHTSRKKEFLRGWNDDDVKTCDWSVDTCNFCKEWYSLVFSFTTGDLTFPDDRPKAILGLAKETENAYQLRYMLGMFHGHLRRQLLWWNPDIGSRQNLRNARPSHRRTPSFSWLDLDTRISTFDWSFTRWLYEIVQLHSHDGSPGSEYTSIEIRCSPMRIYFQNFDAGTDAARILSLSKDGVALEETYTWPDFGGPDMPISSDGREHYVVPMTVDDSSESYTIFQALIVEKVDDELNAFRRIGYLHSKDLAFYPPGYREQDYDQWLADPEALKTINLV